jgi:hypothetical protein
MPVGFFADEKQELLSVLSVMLWRENPVPYLAHLCCIVSNAPLARTFR